MEKEAVRILQIIEDAEKMEPFGSHKQAELVKAALYSVCPKIKFILAELMKQRDEGRCAPKTISGEQWI